MDLDDLEGRGLSSEVVAALKKVEAEMKAAGEFHLADQIDSVGSAFFSADESASYGSSSVLLRCSDRSR